MFLCREKRSSNCEYDEYENQDIGYADIQVTAADPTQVNQDIGYTDIQVTAANPTQVIQDIRYADN